MSWRHVEAAGKIRLARPPLKAVLLALAHHANDFTGRCWPSLERLMLFTGLARRTVQNAIADLEKLKLVAVERGTGTKSSTYVLHLPGVEAVDQGGAPHDERGAPHNVGGAPPAPKSSGNDDRNDARPLAADWHPSDEDLQWAKDNFTSVDVPAETRLFVANAAKKGERYVNASAAWRVWIERGEGFAKRDAQREKQRGTSRGAGPTRSTSSLRQAALAARAADLQ